MKVHRVHMGKDVCFICIDFDRPHSKEGKICLGWDYQPEEDNKYIQMMEALGLPADKIDYDAVYDALEEKRVCDRCAWFFQSGFSHVSDMVLGAHAIHHAYKNPVLRSDWFVDNFMWRGYIAREYDKSNGHRLRFYLDDIEKVREDVEKLGRPIRDSDREALRWSEEW